MARRGGELFSVKVNNLLESVRTDDLRDTFDKYGKVADVYIPRDYHTFRNRGFAFVRFATQDEADDAVSRSEDLEILGQNVRVEHAMYKKNDRPPLRRRSPSRSRRGGSSRRHDSRSRRRDSRSRSRSKGRGRDRRRNSRSSSRR